MPFGVVTLPDYPTIYLLLVVFVLPLLPFVAIVEFALPRLLLRSIRRHSALFEHRLLNLC